MRCSVQLQELVVTVLLWNNQSIIYKWRDAQVGDLWSERGENLQAVSEIRAAGAG